jgi:hypothetical protein
MALKTITSANSVFTLTVLPILPVPFQVQGFASDDAFTVEPVDAAETIMGVDGIMSAGFLPFITPQTITLQADSPSIEIFETWLSAQKAIRELFFAQGTIALPSVQKSYILTKGALKRITQISPARKTLQPQVFQIDWNDVQPVPLVL